MSDELTEEFNLGWEEGRASMEVEVGELRAEIVRQAAVIGWVVAWVGNPVGSYSVSALDGLFGMTRDKIAALDKP